MSTISEEYLRGLPEIYREILSAFPKLEPDRKAGYGLAFQTLYEGLEGRIPIEQIVQACQKMEHGGAVELRQGIFVYPTATGEDIIAGLTGERAPALRVPEFPAPTRG